MKGIFFLSFFFLAFLGCSSGDTANQTGSQKSVVSGQISGLADTTLVFTYTPYDFLAENHTLVFAVDSAGQFSFSTDVENPVKGFLSFGQVPRTYRFEFQTIEGKDSLGIVPSVDFRMVWLYLEPGDSLHFSVSADSIEQTLDFTGTGAHNNTYVNQEEFRFNDYRSKYLGNYYYKTYLLPNEYKSVTSSILQEKQDFLQQFDQEKPLSDFLKTAYLENYRAHTYASWIYYPESHAGFNQGVYPDLPDDYFQFLDEVIPADDFSRLGAGYLSFLNAWLNKKFDREHPEAGDEETIYEYILQTLPDISGYRMLAYRLQRDFNQELYAYFGVDCPYPELADLVTAKFSHLEAMLPGSEVPQILFQDLQDQSVQLSDFAGSYLYLDFWATWCKPCIAEFPYLHEIKKEFASAPIVFIGVSVDRQADIPAWKAFVAENQLSGIQVHAPRDAYEPLKKAWNIRSIPRFVIIDPEGKMYEANAPRPSDPDIIPYLQELLGTR